MLRCQPFVFELREGGEVGSEGGGEVGGSAGGRGLSSRCKNQYFCFAELLQEFYFFNIPTKIFFLVHSLVQLLSF